ncbi:shikimate dehydrogenase [Georgenia faecalis]|uniref:Shikimate dehydrogenase n=1 Tax=Georgenia faecalis TaxID=2483799 RepID=A0ABV9D9U9_9MICO|nr:shikimate dehydrogenase [Georgenia faecalis]
MTGLPTYGELPRDALAPGARRAAVLGRPVAHSLSPVLHHAAYRALGLDWVYGRAEAGEEDLAGLLAALDDQWAGLSLTMPLKHAALGHLDVVDELAEVVGAVNTVLVQPGARGGRPILVGANTDVYGIVAALREAAPDGWRPRTAVVLGAGATAASSLAALGQLGATAPVVVARSAARAAGTLQAGRRMGVDVTLRPWSDAAAAVAGADVVVSTLPAGGADELAAVLGAGPAARPGAVLLDVAYDPWPSALASTWAAAGGLVAPGWGMLLHQGAEQVRLMSGRPAPVAAMRAALEGALAR